VSGSWARWAGVVAAVVLAVVTGAGAAGGPVEVRVSSEGDAVTTVVIRARPEVVIADRTPGAKPAISGQGAASTGTTFSGELNVFLGGFTHTRAAAVDVGDALVSVVRLTPEADGTTVGVFVRQPVDYTVTRPSPLGDVRIEIRSRRRPLALTQRRSGVKGVRPKSTGDGEVAVDAEFLSYDRDTDTLTARGGVTLTRGDTALTTDELVYDRTNGIVEARGHVVLTDPEATVEGDFAHLNLEDESGWIESATADFQASKYIVRAGRLEKLGGPRYSIAKGVFTTCECGGLEKPSWSVACAQTDVKLQGAGVARGVTFRVKDVPVFYFPYLVFPANTERQSGFLMPRVGYSNRRGFQYEQPFFWAIDKSQDATVALDVETEARLGIMGEYRYSLGPRTRGAFTAAYYNEQIRGSTRGTVEPGVVPADIPTDRFALAGHHAQPFYLKSKFYLDMFAVSDDLFLREINNFSFSAKDDLALRSTRYTTSRTGLYKGWKGGLLWGEAAYSQDLVDEQDFALQRLPRVEGEQSKPLLDGLAVARLAGTAVNYQRDQGFDGVRADLAPDVMVPFRLGRVLNGSVTGRVRETLYQLTNREQVEAVVPDPGFGLRTLYRTTPTLSTASRPPRLDESQNRQLAEVRARTASEVSRVFDFGLFGLDKVKHTIEPEAQYLYIPSAGPTTSVRRVKFNPNSNRAGTDGTVCNQLPGGSTDPTAGCSVTIFRRPYLFDEVDAINHRNFFSYGLTTRLLGRAAASAVAAVPIAASEATTGETADGEAEEDDDDSTPPSALEADVLPPGMPAAALPAFVGPPAPGAAPAGPPAPRELARATVLHGYDVSRKLVGDSHQSDVDLGLRLTPVDYLGMSFNTTVSLEKSALRGASIGAFAREPWWTPPPALAGLQNATTVGISYHYIQDSVNDNLDTTAGGSSFLNTPGVNEIDASVYLRLGDYLGFTFLSRYDLNTTPLADGGEIGPHFLERNYLFRLISRCNCWVLEAGISDKTNPDERIFRMQVTLVGLGSFGKTPAARNYIGFAPLQELGFRRPGVGPGRGGY
jgi:lipopolysaccharide assembly outer membrane protein LptD (OstA)